MSTLALVPRIEHLIRDAFLDFRLSREAMNCSPATLEFYDYTAGKLAEWLEARGIVDPSELRSQHVRQYLTELRQRGLKDTSLHGHARAARAFARFLHSEGYIPEPINVDMPRLEAKRLPCLDADQLAHVLDKGCRSTRDKAVVILLADTGLRREEACALNWGDVDLKAGLVRVRRGKGGKAKSRRVLLRYRHSVPHDVGDPVFPSKRGGRLTGMGMRMLFRQIGDRAGLHLTPHMLRRTFATLSLAAGMDALYLQALLGHSSLEMVRRYVQMVEADLQRAHAEHGPVDRWLG